MHLERVEVLLVDKHVSEAFLAVLELTELHEQQVRKVLEVPLQICRRATLVDLALQRLRLDAESGLKLCERFVLLFEALGVAADPVVNLSLLFCQPLLFLVENVDFLAELLGEPFAYFEDLLLGVKHKFLVARNLDLHFPKLVVEQLEIFQFRLDCRLNQI